MMFGMMIMVIGMASAFLINAAAALDCYECVSSGVKSSILDSLFKGKTQANPDCENALITSMGSLPVKTCGTGEVCGSVRGTMKILGAMDFTTVARGCMEAPTSGDTCVPGTHEALAILSFFTLDGADFDGEVCFCDKSLCSAGSCGDNHVKLAGYCMQYWMAAVIALMMIVALLLITCCCCCCCCRCCCGKKRQPGFVVINHAATPGLQYENAVYNQMHTPAPVAQELVVKNP